MNRPDSEQRALEILGRLVGFDTNSARSNLPLVDYVVEYCGRYGVAVDRAPNADSSKAALFLTIGPRIDGGVVLSGHTDCVPVEGQPWTSDPFTLREADGRLYGRGTCDMKGFDAVALAMIPEFLEADLKRPIHILLSYDEEVTCLGPMDIIARFGVDQPRPGIVIVGEPTLGKVADAHKSVCTYRTVVHGIEAHSAKPALGVNAITGAAALVMGLEEIGRDFAAMPDTSGRFDPPFSTVHCGGIEGGTARNILARRCEILWEYRGLPEAPLDAGRRAFDRLAATTVQPLLDRHRSGGRIETVTEVEVPGLRPEPGSVAEVLALRLAQSNGTIAVPFATEAGRFQGVGIPTVVCGPGSIDQAHQPDEYLARSEIAGSLAFMCRLIEACS